MSQQFLGEIRSFGFGLVPKGWIPCDGSLLNVNSNQALFSLLGTTYGGNGQTTFGIPDLRGRMPVGFGTSSLSGTSYVMGQKAGQEQVTLDSSQIPSHSHTLTCSNAAGNARSPVGGYFAAEKNGQALPYSNRGGNTTMDVVVSSAGGNSPHTNLPPLLALNFCIAVTGLFPTRS